MSPEPEPEPEPFSPLDIEGLVLWLDFDTTESLSLFEDQWIMGVADLSGGSNDFEEGETGGPERVPGVLNGRAVARFNTNDEWLRCTTSLALVQPFTVVTVILFTDLPGDVIAVLSGGVDGGGVHYHPVNGGSWFLGLGGPSFPANTFPLTADVPYSIITAADGAGSSFARANGVEEWAGVDPGAGEASSILHLGFHQGFGQALGNIAGSYVAGLLAYDRVLEPAEIVDLEAYLSERWIP